MTQPRFATVRSRFVALLLAASLPLFVMGAVIAYQNSRMLLDAVRERLSEAAADVMVRQESFLTEGRRLLSVLAMSPALTDNPVACASALSSTLAVSPQRYISFALVEPDGRIGCRAGEGGPVLTDGEAEAVATARATGGFAVGPLDARGSPHTAVLPIAIPLGEGAGARPVLLASLDERLLLAVSQAQPRRPGFGAWVLSANRALATLVDGGDGALPAAADISRLEGAGGQVVQGVGRGTRAYFYVMLALPGGASMLLGEPAAASYSTVEVVLGRRLAELALILLAGLGVVALGADVSVGRPLKQVARAVARWRAGGRFDAGPLPGAPREITDLAQSFADAVTALRVREQQLREAASQQELLMQEIHHRVKNNLQVVASLLNLQASRIRHPGARAEFHSARDRIRALATLHRHLYANGELHTINMRGFLGELCEQLLQAMGETAGGGRIALTIEAPEVQISSDQAVPVALLVTEAVSNAVKYAFPGGRSGHIAVHMTVVRDEAGQEVARLAIDDDGIGIRAGRADADADTGDGLGLRLIGGFARQLGSTLQVSEENGTHYVVEGIVLRRERTTELPPSVEDELESGHV